MIPSPGSFPDLAIAVVAFTAVPAFAQDAELAPRAFEQQVLQARPLPLTSVRLTGGPLRHAQDLDAEYLLSLEPDRMLAYYRERVGLPPKAEPYGGWDGGGRNLTGHIAGHYLSAVSLMFAVTEDQRFKERADTIVRELAEVQERHGDGYLCALENGRRAFEQLAAGEIRSAAFDLNGEWAPWYTLHKLFAGLRDAYRHTDNAIALEVEVGLAGWAARTLSGLDDAQIQTMLGTEFGGMNEVLVDLYADTGDRRWLDLSYRFEHRAFVLPLMRHQDILAGKHGNTQVPKMIGSADRFAYTGRAGDIVAASFFWDCVVQHHTYATGGHGKDEYFGPPDQLASRVDGRTAESCNIYNMVKLTRRLFALRPDPIYADFQERALFNHVLGSIDPESGSTCYMVPVGRGVQREYQDMQRSFTCCVGSGMESHALHAHGIYYEADNRLWVNLYAPSTAEWEAAGVRLTMETGFPEGETATLGFVVKEPVAFTLALRRPFWVGEGFAVSVNGEAVADGAASGDGERRPVRQQYDDPDTAGRYVEVTRTWETGDTVQVALPKTLRLEPLPGDPHRVALMWGPLVLAGDLGPEARGRGERPAPPPVLVAAGRPVEEWVVRQEGEPVTFRTDGVGREPNGEGKARDVELVPFYRLHHRRYAAYWDLYTEAGWEEQRARYAAAEERMRRLEAATVARVRPGDPESEQAAGYAEGPETVPQRIEGRRGRRTRSWFSYDLAVEPDLPMAIFFTLYSADRRGTPAEFDVLVDGERIAERTHGLLDPPHFFDVEIPVPPDLVRGKQSVTVRFEAEEGSQVPTVFDLRTIRADAERGDR